MWHGLPSGLLPFLRPFLVRVPIPGNLNQQKKVPLFFPMATGHLSNFEGKPLPLLEVPFKGKRGVSHFEGPLLPWNTPLKIGRAVGRLGIF